MVNGIVVVDNWIGVPDPRIATRQRYYSSSPARVGYYEIYSPTGVVWETETLSSWSEWSCDHDSPCCGCDCDCQPPANTNSPSNERGRNAQNRHDTPGNSNLQNRRVVPEPPPSLTVRGQTNTRHNNRQYPEASAFNYDKQYFSSMEDLIYHTAKQQRHLNDAQRRIQDWMKVMPGLVENDTTQALEQETEKCDCKSCKEERKREMRKAHKERKNKHGAEKKKKRKSRR